MAEHHNERFALESSAFMAEVEVFSASIDSDLVLLDPNSGEYFGLNSVAAFLWKELQSPKKLAELIAETATEYRVPKEECAADVTALVEALVERGLVRTQAN